MENVTAALQNAARRLGENYTAQKLFDLSVGERLPDREEIIEIVNELRKLTFPGFFGAENMAYVSKEAYADSRLGLLYEKLFRQFKVAFSYGNQTESYSEIKAKAQEKALDFVSRLPEIQDWVLDDVDAEFEGDPAANSREEVIFSYPGLYAILVYRYAHVLYEMQIPFIPRIMTEYAHGKTGIDINPGATIGRHFFIDHGTGIVIGETTEIGNNVKIYQGVTLGALSTRKGQQLSGKKRHPTIEDNVVIYSNTTVLGGATVIGANSVIAGNTFIIESVPPYTKVSSTMPALEIRQGKPAAELPD